MKQTKIERDFYDNRPKSFSGSGDGYLPGLISKLARTLATFQKKIVFAEFDIAPASPGVWPVTPMSAGLRSLNFIVLRGDQLLQILLSGL